MKALVLSTALIMYALVIALQNKKVLFTTVAALVVTVAGAVSALEAFTSINFNVLAIYLGSMIIASLFIYSKVPSRIADFFIEHSPSSALTIVAILAMTGIISIFVENVATVLVMAPIALSLSKKLRITPIYFLAGLALMSNLEGTATLVGDPPSMIFAAFSGFTFNDFFVFEGKPSIFFFIQSGLLAGCVFFYFYFRAVKEKCTISPTPVVSFVPMTLLLLMIGGLAAISFLKITFSYATGLYTLALGVIGLFWYKVFEKKAWREVGALVKALDWETIAFLCGIFVVVGAITKVGLLNDLATILLKMTAGNKLLGFVVILLVSVIISGFIDNVPYIIVMLPVASLIATGVGTSDKLYMFALLIGSCLGGNLTPFGASANVAALGILKKEGYNAGMSLWLKIGVPFTLLTTTVAAVFLYLTFGK